MRSIQTAQRTVLAVALTIFVVGAVSIAFVSGNSSSRPASTTLPTVTSAVSSTSAPGSRTTVAPTTVAPTTVAPTTVATTTVAPTSGTATSASTTPTVANQSTAGAYLAGTGFDSNVAFLAALALIAGLFIVWMEERSRLLSRLGPGPDPTRVPSTVAGRPETRYRPRHSARVDGPSWLPPRYEEQVWRRR